MNKTIFKYKGKVIGKLNSRKHNLRALVEDLIEKGVYCQIDKVCEYGFETHVHLSIAKDIRKKIKVLDIAEQFDAAIKVNRTSLPVYRIDSNAS